MWCFVNMQLVAYWAPLNLLCCLCILSCHASLNRTCIILVCASWHVYGCVFTMLVASFGFASLVSFSFVLELWGFVRLRPFVFFMDSFFFLAGSQARWPYPRNHFYLCLLVVCSIAMPRYLPLAYQASQVAMSSSNLFTLPRKLLFGYVTTLLSPSYSIVSCRWSWRLLHDGHDYVGISQYLLFN